QLRAAAATGAHAVEFHTGDYANAADPRDELARLKTAAALSASEFPALEVSGGHGLTQRNVGAFVQAVPTLVSLHIGHALVSDSIFLGIEEAVRRFRDAIGHG
ncbi:MAG: pyridoxine 5'-phosphate synthase, partial [Myxococcota bacterium]